MIWAIVRFQFPGVHRWKDAPEEVAFLKNEHRHIFHCEVAIQQVEGVDRDIEYIMFKNALQIAIPLFHTSVEDSCETMATNIRNFVLETFPDRQVIVQVLEDNENGAMVN